MADALGVVAFEEAVRFGVPAVLAALGAWATVKRKAIANWRRSRKAHRASYKAMVASWPSVVGSIADAPERAAKLSEQFEALHGRLDEQDAALNELLAMNHGQFELSGQATFVCDNEGRNTLVNSAYARILGVGRDDLMEFRYKRFIGARELAAYWPKFIAASEEHREFDSTLWFTASNGERVHVCIRMVPHPRQQGPATHWVGTVTPCEEHP